MKVSGLWKNTTTLGNRYWIVIRRYSPTVLLKNYKGEDLSDEVKIEINEVNFRNEVDSSRITTVGALKRDSTNFPILGLDDLSGTWYDESGETPWKIQTAQAGVAFLMDSYFRCKECGNTWRKDDVFPGLYTVFDIEHFIEGSVCPKCSGDDIHSQTSDRYVSIYELRREYMQEKVL